MKLTIHSGPKGKIVELDSGFNLHTVNDFIDLIGNANYHETSNIIISENNLPKTFFQLKTRMAGEVLQKFSTYNQKLAIIGDFSSLESKSLKDFIRESNRIGRILFVESRTDAISKLT